MEKKFKKYTDIATDIQMWKNGVIAKTIVMTARKASEIPFSWDSSFYGENLQGRKNSHFQ